MLLYTFMGYYLNTRTIANLGWNLSETWLNFERDVMENTNRQFYLLALQF